MIWGIRDKQDNTWMGNDSGPLIYDDNDPKWADMKSTTFPDKPKGWIAATTARTILVTQTGFSALRIVVEPYDCPNPRLKEKFIPRLTPEQAIDHVERGGL